MTTRLAMHEQGCKGLRWYWHTLRGYHVWLADWDYQEAVFLHRLARQRLEVMRDRLLASLTENLTVLQRDGSTTTLGPSAFKRPN